MDRVAIVLRDKDAGKGIVSQLKKKGFKVVKSNPDWVLAMGGDGTVLKAEHQYPSTPILPINTGSLGYLSSGTKKDLPKLLSDLVNRRLVLEERSKLFLKRGDKGALALNEIVVTSTTPGHALQLKLSVNNKRIASFVCDGIIVSSPTGSSAYNLSAGGPLVAPEVDCIIVTALNAHTTRFSPLILGPRDLVSIDIERGNPCISIVADGKEVSRIQKKGLVEVCMDESKAYLLRKRGSVCFSKMRELFT